MADISELSATQSLVILDAVASESIDGEFPVGPLEQMQLLTSILEEHGYAVDLPNAAGTDVERDGDAAKQLLEQLSRGGGEVKNRIDEALVSPPTQENAGPLEIAGLLIVVTGCLVVLQTVGHVTVKRTPNGRWSAVYDPAKKTPFDGTISNMGELIKKIAQLIPGS